MILAAAAAAAAAALFLVPAFDGLSVASRVTGLRSRSDSDSLREGDLERRSVSKRERAGRSGSSLSKRDRGRRSSDMAARGCGVRIGVTAKVIVVRAVAWNAWSNEPPVVCSLAPAVVAFHAAARANHDGRGRSVNQKFWALWGSSHIHQHLTISLVLANERRPSIDLT